MSTRKDLRTSESDWRATKQPTNRPLKAPKKTLKLTTVLKWIAVLLLLGGLYATSPAKKFVECRGSEVPRYCVD